MMNQPDSEKAAFDKSAEPVKDPVVELKKLV
jgi:hypothetical protein